MRIINKVVSILIVLNICFFYSLANADLNRKIAINQILVCEIMSFTHKK
jgi:hypothetical protein